MWSQRAQGRFFRGRRAPDHVWLCTSVELPQYLPRVDCLRRIDVRVRFVSFEPLLGSIGPCNLEGIAWSIVGGESGPGFRPVRPQWVRELRDLCLAQNVKFFFKQWGGPKPKSGGRMLDGRTWDEYPDSRFSHSDDGGASNCIESASHVAPKWASEQKTSPQGRPLRQG